MKKIIICMAMLATMAFANAQDFKREGNTFSKPQTVKVEDRQTKYTWRDSKGIEYPIYMGKSGACYIIRISKKTGEPYKQYLGKEISQQICDELGVKYTPRN